jgi:hypothetical protein
MADPIRLIRQALETTLSNMNPFIPTAFEGVNFEPPVGMYQRCQLVIRQPEDNVFGTAYYRENVDLQVFIVTPSGNGLGEALDQAARLRITFPKGWYMQQGEVSLRGLKTPQIGSTMPADGKVVIPVTIRLTCEVMRP